MARPLTTLFPFPGCVSDEARKMAAVVRTWAQREVVSRRHQVRPKYHELFPSFQRTLATELGLRGLMLPEPLGGGGWDCAERAPDVAALLLEVGRADPALSFLLGLDQAVAVTFLPSEAARKTLAATLLARDPSPMALVLPGAGEVGHDSPQWLGRSIGLRASPASDTPRVSGTVRPLGPGLDAARFAAVFADLQGTPALALIEGDGPGITRGPRQKTTGLEALNVGDVTFDRVALRPELILEGSRPIKTLTLWLDLTLGAASLGAALGFWEILLDWVESKVIKGGVPMKQNPLCAAVVSAVAQELVCAHLLLFDLAEVIAADSDQTPERAFAYGRLLGLKIQRSALAAIDRGLELMGSAGYAKEWHAEKLWRDVKTIGAWLCGVGAEVPAQMDAAPFFFDRNPEGSP